MKKFIVCLLILVFLAASAQVHAAEGRGGLMGFIAGCCFGLRAGGDYNEGKEIHWREWIRVIPVVSIVAAIWDGIEGAQGVTMSEFSSRYGSQFY